MKQLLIIFIACLVLFSCEKRNRIIQQQIEVNDFRELNLESHFDVELIQGQQCKVLIEAPEKLLPKVEISQEGKQLTCKRGDKMSWVSPKNNDIKLIITVDSLELIRAKESCVINSKNQLRGTSLGVIFASKLNEAHLNIQYESFYYWNNFPCGGVLELQGNCSLLSIWNYALMQVQAEQLNCATALIQNSSKGDCHIRASEAIKYHIFGEGNIHLYGNPGTIIQEANSGKGELIIH
ncbi:MAG: DUF2807 domain-containing protein [Bacteroidetes bacterium]|nr:MAG: DUF2807 domain-containing protein [Bacteroidota bacterium]